MNRFREELEKELEGRAAPQRRLLFVGILNKYLPKTTRAVLVGGALVEFYTLGQYVTGDVDMVGDREAIRKLLVAAGFSEEGRYLFRDDLGVVSEVPSPYLRPSETVVEAGFEGYTIPVVGPEDAIVDRLLAAEHWRSPTDWEQAILVFAAQRTRIDVELLRAKAKANDVDSKLEELLRLTGASEPATKNKRER